MPTSVENSTYRPNPVSFTFAQKTAAMMVHIFTASGMVAGFYSLLAASERDFLTAFLMLFLALVIDALDGTFARIFRVGTVLPNFSGKTMDYVIDFANYAVIPAYILYQTEIIPPEFNFLCAALILLISAVYYGKEGMVSNDTYFVGFPVLWNMVVFYMVYIWKFGPEMNVATVVFFSVLHFIPIKFIYPSQTPRFKAANVINTLLFVLSNVSVLLLLRLDLGNGLFYDTSVTISMLTFIYYGVTAIFHTWIDPVTKAFDLTSG